MNNVPTYFKKKIKAISKVVKNKVILQKFTPYPKDCWMKDVENMAT
jgi:hypothetical protein